MMGAAQTSGKEGAIFLQGRVLCHMLGSRGSAGQTQAWHPQAPRPEGKEQTPCQVPTGWYRLRRGQCWVWPVWGARAESPRRLLIARLFESWRVQGSQSQDRAAGKALLLMEEGSEGTGAPRQTAGAVVEGAGLKCSPLRAPQPWGQAVPAASSRDGGPGAWVPAEATCGPVREHKPSQVERGLERTERGLERTQRAWRGR